MARPATLGSTPRPRPVRFVALETQPLGACPRLMLPRDTKLPPLFPYTYTASSQPPAAYSVWLFGAQTSPTCAFSCWMTCFRAGLFLFGPVMSYRKRNWVEAAGSTLPAESNREFIPAVRIARVVPSGLTTAFT